MRTLFAILAFVAIIVAAVTQRIEFVAGAGVLVAISLLSWILPAVRTSQARKKQIAAIVDEADDALDDGIVSIKVVQPEEEEPAHDLPAPDPAPEEPRYMPAPPSRNTFLELPDPYQYTVLSPLLEGFRVSLGARAVCLVRQGTTTYQIVGSAGRRFKRRVGESFDFSNPLISPPETFQLRQVSLDDLSPESLGYCLTPGSIQRVAVAIVGRTPLVLVADTSDEHGLTHPQVPDLFSQFTEILAILFSKEDPTRSRTDIIAEEIARARAADQRLLLALVLLRNAKHVGELGGNLVAQGEDQLQELLGSIDKKSRIVRFGELMFGVFMDGGTDELETWLHDVHGRCMGEEGILSGGVHIGAAILPDESIDAQAFREQATEALVSAYNQEAHAVISDPAKG